jgi:thymidylate synthase
MSHVDEVYNAVLKDIMENGTVKPNRTGIDTKGIFGVQMRFDLRKSFPAVTTKKLAMKSVTSELLWFLEGSGDERRLAEIHFGKPREEITEKKTIWTANAQADYWKPKAEFEGDLGRVYAVQWRHWKKTDGTEVDQIAKIVDTLKNNPGDRRIILTAWNPGELDEMALPPCHCFAQFYVANGELSCQMYQRSCDMFLGVPFNIASYSLLTCMLAQACGLKPGDFVHTLGDAHIYVNHFDQVKEQLSREPYPEPKLKLNPEIKNIDDFKMEDVSLEDYKHHSPIKADMAV